MMHLVNAGAWTFVGMWIVNGVGDSDKLWIVAVIYACLNIIWEVVKEQTSETAVELKNLPRVNSDWEVATDVKLIDLWYSVVHSTGNCFLVRSKQKLPKRFTVGEPVAFSSDN